MVIHHNAEYQTMIDHAEACASNYDDRETLHKAIAKLEQRSQKDQDPIGLAIVEYMKLDEMLEDAKFEEAKKQGVLAITLCEKANLDFYVLRCYNCLAIADSEVADYYASFTNYLKSYQIAEAHPEYKFSSFLLNNIGNLFVWLNEHEIALDYLLRAYEHIMVEHSAESLKTDRLTAFETILLNIIEEYSILGKYDQLDDLCKLITIREAKNQVQMIIYVNEIDGCYQTQQLDKIPELIHAMYQLADPKDNFIYTFRIFLRLFSLCIDKCDCSSAETVLRKLEDMNEHRPMDTFVYDFVMQKYRYYEVFQYDLEPDSQTKRILKEYAEEAQQSMKLSHDIYAHRMMLEKELMDTQTKQKTVEDHNRKLEKDLEKDAFTGILNKYSIEKRINELHAKEDRHGMDAMMLIDIDHFKVVNDTYGHNHGDEVILKVVDMISSCCTKNMIFGRFGGDEFLLYIHHTVQTDYISTFANELIQKAHTIMVANQTHITLSIGVTFLHKEDTFQSGFDHADEALYMTKGNGRDGFTIYETYK